MRDLSTNLQTVIAAQARWPILLCALYLDSTYRYAAYDRPVIWNGQTWTPLSFSFDQITQSAKTILSRATFRFDDAKGTIRTLFGKENPIGKIIFIYIAHLNLLEPNLIADDVNGIVEFRGELGAPSFDNNWCTIPATFGPNLNKNFPSDTFSYQCHHDFGHGQCDRFKQGAVTAQVGGSLKKYFRDTGLGDWENLDDDKLNGHDLIWITGNNVDERNLISDYVQADKEVRFAFDFTADIEVGDIYRIDNVTDLTNSDDIYGGNKKMYATGTAEGGSDDITLVDADRDEADHSWKFGKLRVTFSNGTIEERSVTESDQGATSVTVESEYSSSIVGATYQLYAGCAFSWETCGGQIVEGSVTHEVGGFEKTKFRDTTKPEDRDWVTAMIIYCTTPDITKCTFDSTSGTQIDLVVTGGPNPGTDTLTYADADKDTLAELIAAINALTTTGDVNSGDYTCYKWSSTRGEMASSGIRDDYDAVNITGANKLKKIKISEDYYGWYFYWTGGSNEGEFTTVKDFARSNGEFELTDATTFNISVGDTYIIRNNMYGPAFDNTDNFGGSLDVGRPLDLKA